MVAKAPVAKGEVKEATLAKPGAKPKALVVAAAVPASAPSAAMPSSDEDRRRLAELAAAGDAEAWKLCNATMSRAYDRTKRLLGRMGVDEAQIGERARANWANAKAVFLAGLADVPVTEESLSMWNVDID